jgi:hypothetical protein
VLFSLCPLWLNFYHREYEEKIRDVASYLPSPGYSFNYFQYMPSKKKAGKNTGKEKTKKTDESRTGIVQRQKMP